MRKTILIISSILILAFLSFRLFNKHGNKLAEEKEWYLSNLHYNFSATIDSVQIERSTHGVIYFHATRGSFDIDKEVRAKEKLKLHAVLFLLKEKASGSIEMASEHANQFLKNDSIIVNSDENEIVTYRNGVIINTNDLFTSLRGGEF